MAPYRVRPATLDDRAVLVRHRIGMFADMGIAFYGDLVADRFDRWLAEKRPAGAYRGWLIESEDGEIVAGGGIRGIE